MSDGGKLKREVGVVGATMMGIGSMVGSGVFVSRTSAANRSIATLQTPYHISNCAVMISLSRI
jgi:hypothetical protein